MDTDKEQIKQKLATTRADLLAVTRDLDRETWTQPVYAHADETEWSAMDLLRHLAWAESGMLRLMRQIRAGEEGVPPDFDLDRYNASGVNKLKDEMPAELLQRLENNRQQLLDFVNTLGPDDWDKKGRHGSLRILTIGEILEVIADHEAEHLHDLGQVIA
ncbi:MAG: DinB family protein [Anaerolineae bacterium]|nr:DinB family protein [Anaerolineae bacterium]